jgi:hypothetical protein
VLERLEEDFDDLGVVERGARAGRLFSHERQPSLLRPSLP